MMDSAVKQSSGQATPTGIQDPRKHAIVIGAGFGGLAAAIRLGAKGYRVTVLERLEQPGGRASVFEQDGFRFDAGPTIVTAPFLFAELWELCGKRMEDFVTLKEMSPCYTIRFDDGDIFRCYADKELMLAEIRKLSPQDIPGYEAFLKESEACYRTGFVGMVDKPFGSLLKMVQALPALIVRRADRSVYRQVSRFVRNEKLRIALSFHPLFIGGNPMRASALYSLISYLEQRYGVHYAMGGTGELARGMADLVGGQGNKISYHADVDEILVETGRAVGVRLADGSRIPADIVVSNADSAWTYGKMIAPEHRSRWTDRKLAKADYSMSLFVWYFGTSRHYPDVDHHTILMGPRFGPLLEDIFERKILAEDFSLYLHRPTATDPSVAPAGCDAYYVLAPVPNLDGSTDWTQHAETFRKKIEGHLEETIMPGLSEVIATSRIMTPLDFRDRLCSIKGAAFGLEPRLLQTAWFRPHNVSEEIQNLYITGAGTHPGAGMPGVIASAKILTDVVPDENQFSGVTR